MCYDFIMNYTFSSINIYMFFISAFLVSGHLQANEPQAKIFKKYITTNKEYEEKVKVHNEKIVKLTFPKCQDDINYARLKPSILVEPVFFNTKNKKQEETIVNKNFNPSRGQWIEKSMVTACGNKTIVNHLVVAEHVENTPTFFPMINGQTKINQIYQSRVIDMIVEKLRNDKTKCHGKIFTNNTGVIGYRNPETNALSKTDHDSGWFERWIIKACDKSYDINIATLPDPKTTYRFIVKIAK